MPTTDLLPRLQALLTIWDQQAASAGAFYTGAIFGYEDCADGLATLLKEVLAAEIER